MRNGLLFGVYERQIRARATPAFFQFFQANFIMFWLAFGLISKALMKQEMPNRLLG